MTNNLRSYFIITSAYWTFTLSDGAIRMLVVLFFHQLGYSPFEVASLFLFYEFFGIVTNLIGGWIASRLGLNVTMHLGMGLQVVALLMLSISPESLSVVYVMFAQALSGIAKDLNKMSAKASVKMLVNKGADVTLFKWVAILTGSKNTLKGLGFFLGAFLLQSIGFQNALYLLASGLFIVLISTFILLPSNIGVAKNKAKFTQILSSISNINWLSAARFFLFGARDIWFVVALPVFLYETLRWSYTGVGSFIALWIIGYGIVQASTPMLLRGHHPSGKSAQWLAIVLAIIPALIAIALSQQWNPTLVIVMGLFIFGIAFAINSAVHSYLILAYSDHDAVARNVAFYYMSNAGGRLSGTVLSGLIYQHYGLIGCLWSSASFVLIAAILSTKLKN